MLLSVEPDHPHYEHIKIIEQCVHSGAALTRQLLGFARRGQYEIKSTDLGALVKDTVELFGRARRDLTIHTSIQEGVRPVKIDRGQIEQVLFNLYVNAWQAMPDGGNLFINRSGEPPPGRWRPADGVVSLEAGSGREGIMSRAASRCYGESRLHIGFRNPRLGRSRFRDWMTGPMARQA